MKYSIFTKRDFLQKTKQPIVGKYFLPLFFSVFIYLNGHAQPFITTWKTDNFGSSNSTSITVPTFPGATYNYDVDWDNDGTFDQFGITGDVTHDYGVAGTVTIRIQGTFPRIYFNYNGDKEKILSIDQWGSIAWTSMNAAFYGATNLTYNAIDAPDLSSVTDMSGMFSSASSFNGNINSWDVSAVTDMSYLFASATSFNQDLNLWNVANVTNMIGMFSNASVFNGNISSWNVANVTSMSNMFSGAYFFNQDLNGWNVANVTSMSNMFSGAHFFNQDLNGWNVANVTSMSDMFLDAHFFNGNISTWNTANVTTMSSMFQGAVSFNQDISAWNVGNVVFAAQMFLNAHSFNQNISAWDISSVIDMRNMFAAAGAFDQNLGNWDIGALNFNMQQMLGNSGMSVDNYDNTLIGWESQGVSNNSLYSLGLGYCAGQTARASLIGTYGWSISGDVLACSGFITTWKTDNFGSSNSTSITVPTFPGATYNYDVDWDNDGTFDQSGITGDVTHDYGVAGTVTIRIQGTFPRIYFNGGGDSQKLLSIDQWGNIAWTSMNSAFNNCVNMVNNAGDVPNLSGVTDISGMFAYCSLFDGDLSGWDVSNVTAMLGTFLFASAFNGDVTNWDVSNVTNMSNMFFSAGLFNQNISTWTVNNVTDMSHMFEIAFAFDQNLGAWNIGSVTDMTNMLDNCGMSVGNYDNTLIGWESQGVSNITLGANLLEYCNGEMARNSLINTYGWTINGDALNCGALPVELINLNARTINNENIKLEWQTASEQDNDGFEIQKSADGIYWENIGFVEGRGNFTGYNEYVFTDKKPYTGINYYRLKQWDYNGESHFSKTVSANIENISGGIYVYPNPAFNDIYMSGKISGEIIVSNYLGQIVFHKKMDGENRADISGLPEGIYGVVVLEERKRVYNGKIMKGGN